MVDQSQKISKSSSAFHPSEGAEQSVHSSRPAPSPEQLRRLLTSSEGQALIRLLQADGGAGLKQAADALKAGNTEEAKAALAPLLAGTEAEALAQSLEGKL